MVVLDGQGVTLYDMAAGGVVKTGLTRIIDWKLIGFKSQIETITFSTDEKRVLVSNQNQIAIAQIEDISQFFDSTFIPEEQFKGSRVTIRDVKSIT